MEAGSLVGRGGTEGKKGQGRGKRGRAGEWKGGGGAAGERVRNPPPTYVILN